MLRFVARLTLVFCVTAIVNPMCATAADNEAMALIEKGIAFMGGAKNLKKYKAATWNAKGLFYGLGGDGLPYSGKHAMERPGKFRVEVVGIMTQIYDGKRGWVQSGGQTTAMTKEQLDASSQQHYFSMVTALFPLRDKKFELSLDGKEKVNGDETLIVKVQCDGHHDARLFLEVNTGRLVKSEHLGPMEGMPDKIVKYEAIYQEYKSAGEIKFPSKVRMWRDGKKLIEATHSDYKPAVALDPNLLAKPN